MTYQPKPEEYAAIYARKSTKMESYSLQTQASLARKVIDQKNLFVYDVYEDEESATKYHPMHRAGFKKLLYDAMNGKFKTVVVFRRDRLARKTEDLLEIKRFFNKYGIKIIYSNQGEFQPDEDSYISSFIENIIMSVDELEPGILRERITAGKEQKRLRGEYSGREPFGYSKIVSDDKKTIVPNDDALIVKEIFDGFLNDVTTASSFDYFTEKMRNKFKNKKLTKKRIIDILLRPLYGGLITVNANQNIIKTIERSEDGKFIVNKDLYRDCTNILKSSSIISKDKWYISLAKLNTLFPQLDNVEEEEENYLFKNLVQCGACKETIYLSDKHYKCICGCVDMDIDEFEDMLLKEILNGILKRQYIKTYQEKLASDLDKYIAIGESEIEKSKKNQEKILNNLIENYSSSATIDYSSLKSLIDKQNKLMEYINDKKEEALRKNITIEKLENIIREGNSAIVVAALKINMEVTQEFLSNIIKGIVTPNAFEVISNEQFKFFINFT